MGDGDVEDAISPCELLASHDASCSTNLLQQGHPPNSLQCPTTPPPRQNATHPGLRIGRGLPTPPPTEGNTPGAGSTSVFVATQLSPLAFAQGPSSRPGLQRPSMASLKRKAEDEGDVETLRPHYRVRCEDPAVSFVDEPIVMVRIN